jgi:hypothetical protein
MTYGMYLTNEKSLLLAKLRYDTWCRMHFQKEGEAKCWKIYEAYCGFDNPPQVRIVFEHEEDLTAFKLAFGL